jgi:hypothetical protein
VSGKKNCKKELSYINKTNSLMLYCLNKVSKNSLDLGTCLAEAKEEENELVEKFRKIMQENAKFKLIVIQTICSQSPKVVNE